MASSSAFHTCKKNKQTKQNKQPKCKQQKKPKNPKPKYNKQKTRMTPSQTPVLAGANVLSVLASYACAASGGWGSGRKLQKQNCPSLGGEIWVSGSQKFRELLSQNLHPQGLLTALSPRLKDSFVYPWAESSTV